MTLRRDDALRALIPHVKDEDIVVAVYQSCFDWHALCPRPLNYVAVGAMGQASSHGLGLALANPDRKVIVLDGDGSLLMNLGSLVTIANAAVTNFYHFPVCEPNLRGEWSTSGTRGRQGQLRRHGACGRIRRCAEF